MAKASKCRCTVIVANSHGMVLHVDSGPPQLRGCHVDTDERVLREATMDGGRNGKMHWGSPPLELPDLKQGDKVTAMIKPGRDPEVTQWVPDAMIEHQPKPSKARGRIGGGPKGHRNAGKASSLAHQAARDRT